MNPWFLLAVMSLATFILTKLVVELDFPPVLWLRDRVVGGLRPPTSKEQHHPAYPAGRGLAESTPLDVPGLGKIYKINDEIHVWKTRSKRIPLFFSDLMSCPWCASGWIAASVITGTWLTVGLPVPVLMWPAVWALGALLAQHEWD